MHILNWAIWNGSYLNDLKNLFYFEKILDSHEIILQKQYREVHLLLNILRNDSTLSKAGSWHQHSANN